MHEEVHEGGVLHVSAPKNHFPLVVDAPHSLLFAGGIGVTPLLAMAAKLSEAGAKFNMHYCTRSRARTAFIPGIAVSSFGANVQFHFDDGSEDEKLNIARVLSRAQAGTHLYVCGPSGFMDTVLSGARALSWPEQQIHFEYFAVDAQQNVPSDEFEVLAARSGTLVHVGKDQTVLQALAEAGIDVPSSCEQGMCGTCVTTIIEGVPDHRDIFLSPEQRARSDVFLPCCSRAKSARLVVDL